MTNNDYNDDKAGTTDALCAQRSNSKGDPGQEKVVDSNKEARMAAAEEALVLLEQERLSFEAWRDSLETVPTIKKLRAKAEAIRLSELEKASRALGAELSKKERKVLEELSRGITNKLLHGPMQALRSDGTDAQSVSSTLVTMQAITQMYSLSEQDLDLITL